MVRRQPEQLPGSNLPVFYRLLEAMERLVNHLDGVTFHSLYTLLPLATQLLGLETPRFGSGKSPFSLISLLPFIKDPNLLTWPFDDLSLPERRVLIDEIYAMTAPLLLGEEEAYTELLIDTVHRDDLREESRQEAFRTVQRQKFEALAPLAHRVRVDDPSHFAHISHYGYAPDLEREHAFLKKLPPELIEAWSARSFPTVFEANFRHLAGRHSTVRGWALVINNSTEQLLASHKLRKAKIVQCARLADRLGAQVVGMAGLIAFFGNGGQFLSDLFPQLSLSTGHAYTIANILEIGKASAARVGLNLQEATVAVVGAAGSIGSGCARLFAQLGVGRLVLIDVLEEPLAATAAALRRINEQIEVRCSVHLQEMRTADLTVVATNAVGKIISADFLKPGAIVIDDSFPKNVPETIVTMRPDVIALDGSPVRLPSAVEIDHTRNAPNIMDFPLTRMLSCHEVVGCFAETLILVASGQQGNYGLGPHDPVLADDILAKGRSQGFTMAPLQFYGYKVTEQRFRQAARIRKEAERHDSSLEVTSHSESTNMGGGRGTTP